MTSEKIKVFVESIPQYTEPKLDDVVDSVIHGLIGKYPKREYQPGWTMGIRFMVTAPVWMTSGFSPF